MTDEIAVSPHPNHTAVTFVTGESFTNKQLGDFKASPLYAAHPTYRAGVDRLHELAEHGREMERRQRQIARRKP